MDQQPSLPEENRTEPKPNDTLRLLEEAKRRPHMQKPGPKFWAAVAALLVVGLWFLAFRVNRFSLTVSITGEPEIIVEYGKQYSEPGASAVLSGTYLFPDGILPANAAITIDSDLKEDTVGKYTVTYTANYLWWTAKAQRTVRIVDLECPVITLVDSGKTILPGMIYEEEGFSAFDNYDGDLTDQVRRIEDMGMIRYVVQDSSGNPTAVERTVPYYDPFPPEIRLYEGEQLTIDTGTVFRDPGFQATDNVDGDLNEQVLAEGEVVWHIPGTYQLTYTVTDSYENVTTVTRTVEVVGHKHITPSIPGGKVIYLTFDDGPGPYTETLLRILDKYGVKATFFVTDSGYEYLLQRMVDKGHSIGIHSASHDYEAIYADLEAYFTDFHRMRQIILDTTGVNTTLMRFPGGSSNLVSSFNPGIMTELTRIVQDGGYQYFDWNVDSEDAGGATTARAVRDNVIRGVQEQRVSVVLLHDIHDYTVEAVEGIVKWGLNNGYTFLPLKQESPNMHHPIQN